MRSGKLAIMAACSVIGMGTLARGDYQLLINGTSYRIGWNGTIPVRVTNNPVADKTPRFVTCANHAGSGFFWIDTSSGAVWLGGTADNTWVYCGAPESPQSHPYGQTGRFMPHENVNGAGLFILDTLYGDGWWTNGKQWQKMGQPEKTPQQQNSGSLK